MDLNRTHTSGAGGVDDEPEGDAGTGRAPGLAQAMSRVTRRLRLALRSDPRDRGGDDIGGDEAANPEAVRRVFLDAALEPARRPPRRSQPDQAEPSPLVAVGPGIAQQAAEVVAEPAAVAAAQRAAEPVVAEPVVAEPVVAEPAVPEPVVAGPLSADPTGTALVAPDASTDGAISTETSPPTSLLSVTGGVPHVPAPLPEHGDVPASATVAADDFFVDLVRRVGRRP